MEWARDIWTWAKTAPLPVVLALNVCLATWVYAIADEQQAQKGDAKASAQAAKDSKEQIDRANDKLDKLIQAAADLAAEIRAHLAAEVRDKKAKP